MSITDIYVTQVYDKIAQHFNHTRAYTWQGVETFLCSIKPYSQVLEIGAGNGKNLLLRPDLITTALDLSPKMAEICYQKKIQVVIGNSIHLPYRDHFYDATISVAVLHHLDTDKKRYQAIREQVRVTRPGGRVYIQVWANMSNKKPKKFINLPDGSPGDYLVRWQKLDGQTYYRYYHLFQEAEFLDLFKKSQDIKLVNHFYERDNWIAILQVT